MDTKLRRIFKKLLGSHLLKIQDIFGRNEKETEWSAEYQLSIIRKKEEAIAKTEETSTNKSNIHGPTETRRTPKKDLLVPKKALIWDPRVRGGLLTASQLFNINQWLLSLENQQPYDLQDVIESTNDEEDPAVDQVDKMLDSFQDFGGSIITRRLTTLV